ncbi:nuclear transport factor 2 family protein [Haloglycomyces albus]|uniref:nuclear transport factor 2 family protein n=1 Tax=Haloglycomyces albus TaxID=526067 RepID=UPI00046D26BD|nr:nuclear transport factor 2 family protein [Haloglycomyces albus]
MHKLLQRSATALSLAAVTTLAVGSCSSPEEEAQEALEDSVEDLKSLSKAIGEADVDTIYQVADDRLCEKIVDPFKKSFEAYEDLSDEELEEVKSEKGRQFEEYDFEVTDVEVDGDEATVTVEASGFDPVTGEVVDNEEQTVKLTQEDGSWKLCPDIGTES